MTQEIVIIGGGPIGTWTALQIKKRNSAIAVTIYERFQTYKRDHIMTIQEKSFRRSSADALQEEAFLHKLCDLQATCSELCKPVSTTNKAGQFVMPPRLDIRTIEFEHFMKQECRNEGVNFVYKRVESPEVIMGMHPGCRQFIAADGANSSMRSALWGEESMYRYKLFPSLDFKYKAVGQPRYMLESTFADIAHLGLEYVSMQGPDGLADVNLRFIVSQENYDKIRGGTFKEPLVVQEDSPFWGQMHGEPLFGGRTFKEDFYGFLKRREDYAGEVRANTPITMTKIYLARYTTNSFAKMVPYKNEDRGWFLVGDAAMGMPFFRSVNSGLILGAQLGQLLAMEKDVTKKVHHYNKRIRPMRILEEFAITKYLECKVHFLQKFARPILFHAARVPGLKRPVVQPFDYIARLRGARFP